jgi:versiconal hemiacetal acetate esterase
LISKLTFPAPDLSVKTEDKKISEDVSVRIYTPPNYTGGKPAGLFIHGGGWVLGDLDGEDGCCRSVAKDAGVILVSVDYRLAPKHKFPAALDDCLLAYHWVLENASYLNTTPSKVFAIGGSSGGGLALGVALRLIDTGLGETVKGIVSLVPVTIHPDACPERLKSEFTSYNENAEYTVNTKSAMRAFFGK